jgi:LPXTG-motif cell wall-anchored protein
MASGITQGGNMRHVSWIALTALIISSALAQTPAPGTPAPGGTTGSAANWWWIILLVIIVAAAIWYFMRSRNRI